ncbi:hypothetical protein [Parabacteroides sp. PF5-9]|uniref:hypothetical protein n=1 Tax=Parabacteroides sp. PF5-9 TaxID=1742404 RepID=UPI0024757D4E|nr:hypothetical protein [Parabacteroides sp. PF5-9]MDH6356828.1 hypothetical protein [Parabacteroides sp. PF5-9]
MKKSIIAVLSWLCLLSHGIAQEQPESIQKLQRLKVSGYIQTQYQRGEEHASLKVGSANENLNESFNRIGIRRGRIKFVYEKGITSGVFQLDLTEKGLGFKDVYLNIKDPWLKSNSLKAGVFDRPFGYEIGYSSSRRESPERSTIFQTLFPDERDLGAMIALQAGKDSPLNFIKLEAGLFAGNGIKQEIDSRKDFIGHLSADKKWNNLQLSGGLSYYNGSVYQGTENVYSMNGNSFILINSADNVGKFAKREYIGFDLQFDIESIWGITAIRTEYLFGTQPGKDSGSKSPNSSSLPRYDTYIRDFAGGYVILIQDLGRLPFTAVLKYDWYDPNTKIVDHEIGLNHTTKGDIAQNTLGLGMLWNINANLRLQAYYEINKNEKTKNISGYEKDRKDDVFTLRLQYKF